MCYSQVFFVSFDSYIDRPLRFCELIWFDNGDCWCFSVSSDKIDVSSKFCILVLTGSNWGDLFYSSCSKSNLSLT